MLNLLYSFLTWLLGLKTDRGYGHAGGAPRSGKWPTVRKHFLKTHPECAACGGTEDLQVHHKLPFHKDPAKELDPSNLITLCEHPSHDCHLVFGHLLDFHSYNPHVVLDAARFRAAVDSRP